MFLYPLGKNTEDLKLTDAWTKGRKHAISFLEPFIFRFVFLWTEINIMQSILRVQEDWVTKKIWWLKMNHFNLKKYLHEKSEKEKIEWNCAVHPFPLLLLSSNDQRASWVQSQRWVNLCSYSSAEVWSIF